VQQYLVIKSRGKTGDIIGYVPRNNLSSEDCCEEQVIHKCLAHSRFVSCNKNARIGFGTFAGIPLTYCLDHKWLGEDFVKQLFKHRNDIRNIVLKGYKID